MRLTPSPVAALLLAVSLAVAALQAPAAQAQAAYSQAKLEAFVKAALHVEAILARWTPQIKEADGAQKDAIKKQVNAELHAAISQAEGITPDEYGQIVQATRSDQELSQRVSQIYREMKPK